MFGLLQAYGSDSDSSSSDKEQEEEEIEKPREGNKLPNPFDLPKPEFETKDCGKPLEKSVFINPYVEADNAKQALLEKHVKMISTDVKNFNGKKICWNFRKSKCRFGHNCKYAHDSDLQTQQSQDIQENNFQQSTSAHVDDGEEVEEPLKKKKRPGLSATVIPSKKVMTAYFVNKIKRK